MHSCTAITVHRTWTGIVRLICSEMLNNEELERFKIPIIRRVSQTSGADLLELQHDTGCHISCFEAVEYIVDG